MKAKITTLVFLAILLQSFGQLNHFRPVAADDNTNVKYLDQTKKVSPVEFDDQIKLFIVVNNIVAYQKMDLQLDSLERATSAFSNKVDNGFNGTSIIKVGNESVYVAFINSTGDEVYLGKSSDKGETFIVNKVLDASPKGVSLFQASNNDLFLTLITENSVINYVSNDDGTTWSGPYTIQSFTDAFTHSEIIETNSGSVKAIISRTENGESAFYSFTSNDNGQTWTNEELVKYSDKPITRFVINRDNNKSTVVYNKVLTNNAFDVEQSDIFYLETEDGINWSQENQFTTYLLNDNLLGIGLYDTRPLVLTKSTRHGYDVNRVFFSAIGETIDDEPPAIFDFQYLATDVNSDVSIKVYADDLDGISSITVSTKYNEYELYDDGNSNDSTAGDNIFGTKLVTLSKLSNTQALLNINNLHFPFNNSGILGAVNRNFNIPIEVNVTDNNSESAQFSQSISKDIDDYPYVRFNNYLNASLVFGGGFYLSGYEGENLWANGETYVTLVEDYVPGNIDAVENDPSTMIYSVFRDDPDFGNSWQLWKDAVDAGAYFYDGDGDGEYNPIDLNGNGSWDSDEDKPDLLYDATYFTVFNDGVPAEERKFDTVEPLGIEVRETVFASAQNSLLNNVVFVRYSLLYKGKESQSDTLKDVIFTMWNDSDIGDYTDDLTGTDTTLNSVYSYNDGEDGGAGYLDGFGENPPAAFFTLVQGPRKYTGNQDDIAYNRFGPDLGEDEFSGYVNLNISSSFSNVKSTVLYADPYDKETMRYNAEGKENEGNFVDPCDFPFGEVFGNISCQDIQPEFLFSGDPVKQDGWLNTAPADTRQILNTGNFDLVKDEPIDIIVAYSAERGTDALNSVSKARQTVNYIHEEYENNFGTLVGVKENSEELAKSFSLSQNYPNPFNPTSKIKYQIAKLGKVELRVYDILGREITTLVNKIQSPGNYEITFNASQLASGVYFYRLTAGNFVQTRKMMLIK